MNITDGPAHEAARKLRAKLNAAAIEALRSGKDWAEGPYEFPLPDLFPAEPQGLFEPVIYSVQCKAGPVDSTWMPPEGWRVIRHADWVAAGRPFDVDYARTARFDPQDGCPVCSGDCGAANPPVLYCPMRRD